MRHSMSARILSILARVLGAAFVLGLALACGRFVEDRAAARRLAHQSAEAPQAIVPLSATATSTSPIATPAVLAANCRPQLALAARAGAVLAVTVDAPCAADSRIEISHGGMTVALRMPAGRPLHLTLPALEAQGRVAVRLSDGTEVTASAALADLDRYRRFALTWAGAAEVDLHGVTDGQDLSAQDPGAGPGQPRGWMASLGDSDLDQPLRAQVFTLPLSGDASTRVELTATAETCGQSLLGQTISSTGGRADAAALRVDLPECGAEPVVLHLKNLDQDVKLALR